MVFVGSNGLDIHVYLSEQPHCGCVDLVILAVGSDKPNEHELEFIINVGNQAVVVSVDVEHDALAGDDAGCRKGLLQVGAVLPLGFLGDIIPGGQGLLGSWVSGPEFAERAFS